MDVRTLAEFRDGHARGALSIPLDSLSVDRIAQDIGSDDMTDRAIYLLCESGFRAEQAATRLQQQGVSNVQVVNGGTSAWRDANLPMVRTSHLPSLEHQTQIALGSILLLILIKGALIHPVFFRINRCAGSRPDWRRRYR